MFFADERVVALDHPDSNYNACSEALFNALPFEARRLERHSAALTGLLAA